ncbi:DUF2948 family protein [Aestuariibius insulae]|uniref:DUF2948 family protein n=1 Tax=Aestuariibius insulae TaxID=2058287 RepID=UPI00345E0891
MTDASFADGGEKPLRLVARDSEDLKVISSLLQDAVFPGEEMLWKASDRRFAILLNRFRWEDKPAAERRGRDFERVQAVLAFEDVTGVASQGVVKDPDIVLSLLTIEFEAEEDGTGAVILTLAGDGAIRVEVEALEVLLRDVTRPYRAPSRKAPEHDV